MLPTAPMTAAETARRIAARELTAERAASAALDRLRETAALNAFIDVFEGEALDRAREIDRRLDAGEDAGPLAGVPIAIKDNICLGFGRTTAGSKLLENYRSPFSATAAQRLIDAGAVVIGKTNLDEFAMGSSTEHSAFGPTRNPHAPDRVPGGSSGGSAAAVAAGVVPLALGSDTGGSVRQPAAMCGLVGVKPTYGLVSRYGLIAYASSLDQIGPIARTVEDAAACLRIICGHDPRDATSRPEPGPPFLRVLREPAEHPPRIGVPAVARGDANHPGVIAAVERAIAAFERLGAEIVEVRLPNARAAVAAYYLVAPAEASSNLARFDGVRYGRRAEPRPGEGLEDLYVRSRTEGLGPEVRHRILLGTHALSSGYYEAYYNTALKVRRLVKGDFDRCFAGGGGGGGGGAGDAPGLDAVLLPTSPHPAWPIGSKADDPIAEYLEDAYTVSANLAGLPAVSLPAGFAEEGGARLPVGVQLIGPAFADAALLRTAALLESALAAD